MNAGRKCTEGMVLEMLKMHADGDGFSVAEIAKHFGLNWHTVYYQLKRAKPIPERRRTRTTGERMRYVTFTCDCGTKIRVKTQ